MQAGDYRGGWPLYEARWKTDLTLPKVDRPLWDGSSLDGKTILLTPEQGLGDTIQFIRYAALVKALGATVVVKCQKALLKLLASCLGIDVLLAADEDNPPFGRIQIDPIQCIGCKKCLSKGPDGCFLDGCPWDAIVMVDIAEVEKEVGPMAY